jgi:uncharacterized caspase-like protein
MKQVFSVVRPNPRVGNGAMHNTLGKLGFSQVGGEWPSGQSPENLRLFTRDAV